MGMFHIREHLITQIGPVAQSGQGAVPLERKRRPPEPVVVGSKPTGPVILRDCEAFLNLGNHKNKRRKRKKKSCVQRQGQIKETMML
jgi:hypothetical protein